MKKVFALILLLPVLFGSNFSTNLTNTTFTNFTYGDCITDNVSGNVYCPTYDVLDIYVENSNYSDVARNITFVHNQTTILNNTIYVNNTERCDLNLNLSCTDSPQVYVDSTKNYSIVVNPKVCSVEKCVYRGNVSSSSDITRLTLSNSSCDVDISVLPISSSYCYENRNEQELAPYVFYSPKSNNTFKCNLAPATPCPVCEVCPEPVVCREPVPCPACEPTEVYHLMDSQAQNLSCERTITVDICQEEVKTKEQADALLAGQGSVWADIRNKECLEDFELAKKTIGLQKDTIGNQTATLQNMGEGTDFAEAGLAWMSIVLIGIVALVFLVKNRNNFSNDSNRLKSDSLESEFRDY